MRCPSLCDVPTGTSLAASLFSDFGGDHTELRSHVLVCDSDEICIVPAWLVDLFELAPEGSVEARRLREELDGEVLFDVEDTYVESAAVLLYSRYVSNRVNGVVGALSIGKVDALRGVLSPTQSDHRSAAYTVERLMRATRVHYPCMRRNRTKNTVMKEYVARCAQALAVYTPQEHGTWPPLNPSDLARRILRLSVNIAATSIHTTWKSDGMDDAYRTCRTAEAHIVFLLNATAIAGAHTNTTQTTSRHCLAECYVGQWNNIFAYLQNG